jgi:hypothetical protein
MDMEVTVSGIVTTNRNPRFFNERLKLDRHLDGFTVLKLQANPNPIFGREGDEELLFAQTPSWQ